MVGTVALPYSTLFEEHPGRAQSVLFCCPSHTCTCYCVASACLSPAVHTQHVAWCELWQSGRVVSQPANMAAYVLVFS